MCRRSAKVVPYWQPCGGVHLFRRSTQYLDDTDESVDGHHTRYGVSTSIQGDNGVFGASAARAGALTVLLGTYQRTSQPVFQPAYMGHPMVYSSLNGQTHVVGSDYCPGFPQIAGMPISASFVTLVSTRAPSCLCRHECIVYLVNVETAFLICASEGYLGMADKHGVEYRFI